MSLVVLEAEYSLNEVLAGSNTEDVYELNADIRPCRIRADAVIRRPTSFSPASVYAVRRRSSPRP
jgi:hypothetical protein